jgi:hypothetical protein
VESGSGHDGFEMDDEEENEFWHSEIGKHSLYVLSHVPAFHSHILELLAASRRSKTTRRFLLALTTGTADGPPLEMKAHDAVACEFACLLVRLFVSQFLTRHVIILNEFCQMLVICSPLHSRYFRWKRTWQKVY